MDKIDEDFRRYYLKNVLPYFFKTSRNLTYSSFDDKLKKGLDFRKVYPRSSNNTGRIAHRINLVISFQVK